MNFLAQLDDRFPIITIGTASGMGAWILAHTEQITGVAGMVGAVCSATLAGLMLATKLICLALRARESIRCRLRNREQRRAFETDRLP